MVPNGPCVDPLGANDARRSSSREAAYRDPLGDDCWVRVSAQRSTRSGSVCNTNQTSRRNPPGSTTSVRRRSPIDRRGRRDRLDVERPREDFGRAEVYERAGRCDCARATRTCPRGIDSRGPTASSSASNSRTMCDPAVDGDGVSCQVCGCTAADAIRSTCSSLNSARVRSTLSSSVCRTTRISGSWASPPGGALWVIRAGSTNAITPMTGTVSPHRCDR